jgi:hypothetical protein
LTGLKRIGRQEQGLVTATSVAGFLTCKASDMDNQPATIYEFRRGIGSVLMIACGALAKEIEDLIEINDWRHLDVTCLPAKLDHAPKLIAEALRNKIEENRMNDEKIYVLYGDYGTGGELDLVLAHEGNVGRIPRPHCFSFFAGNEAFAAKSEDDLTTFFLTD